MAKKLIFPALVLFLIISCGYYEGVVQPTPKSYLSFTGNVEGAIASVDNTVTLYLDRELRAADGGKRTVLFQITPGKHNVIVTKMGREVVNRVVIVADGATKEIEVP